MSEWISVKDRLPDSSEIVIVEGGIARFVRHPYEHWVTETSFSHGREIQWEVTHWMPLPEPPEATSTGESSTVLRQEGKP